MIRAYRLEYYNDHHSLWETDPVHIVKLEEWVRVMTKSSREWEQEFPPDRGPTPLGAEQAESYGNAFWMTQRLFPSQAAVDTANTWEHLWMCAESARHYRWECQTPEMRDSPLCGRRRERITMEALTQDIYFPCRSDTSPYFASEDWQLRLFAQRACPQFWAWSLS